MNHANEGETMPTLRHAIALLVMLLWCLAPMAVKAADIETHAEVEALLNRHADAYAKRDLPSIMSLFASDAEVMLIVGGAHQARYTGPDQIKASYEADFAATASASMKFNWVSVRSKGDVAWFATECLSTIEVEKQKVSFPIVWTGVAEKRNNNWFFVQCHVSIAIPESRDGE
jgi:uncharacterized protein (TIGR02246 family)